MKIFMLLTFGFLIFAFYELSGGSDFDPQGDRAARMAANTAETPAVEVTRLDTATPSQSDAEETIIADTTTPEEAPVRVSVDVDSINDAVTAATDELASLTNEPALDDDLETQNANLEQPEIVLPSLIAPSTDATEAVELAAVEPILDVREVSGNRVNVRGGPSTSFGIVGRLARGDAVEVLEDNGDGWVRMRPVEGGEEGWMADFLLTNG